MTNSFHPSLPIYVDIRKFKFRETIFLLSSLAVPLDVLIKVINYW